MFDLDIIKNLYNELEAKTNMARDKLKRPDMLKKAIKYSSQVVFTSDNSRDDLTKMIVLTSIIDPPAETAKFRNINPLNSDILKYLLIPRVRLILKLFSFSPDILDKNGKIIADINNAETK